MLAIFSADSSGRQIIWFVWSLLLTEPRFQLVFHPDFCLKLSLSLIYHLLSLYLSNVSHFLSTHFVPLFFLHSLHPHLPCLLPYWIQIRAWFLIGPFIWRGNRLNHGWQRRESQRERGWGGVGGLTVSAGAVCLSTRTCVRGEWLKATNRDSSVPWSSSMALSQIQGYCHIPSSSALVSVLCGPVRSIRHRRDVDINTTPS